MAGGTFCAPGVASAEVTVTSTDDAEAQATGEGAVLNKATNPATIYSLKNDTALTLVGGPLENANFAAGFSDAAVSGYTLTVNSGTFDNATSLAGGWSKSGTANGNTVYVNGGEGGSEIYGGLAQSGASDNTVEISGGEVGSVYGGSTTNGDADGNTVTVSDGDMRYVHGGSSNGGAAKNNVVTISGGGSTISGVYGGKSTTGAATGNTVNISGGTILKRAYKVYGGSSDTGAATDNTVNISGGTIQTDVYGGSSDTGAAKNNVVTISGGTITGDVYGGYSYEDAATDNTVNILAAVELKKIYGGLGASSSGNTVNFAAKGITVSDNIYNAQNLNFYLPQNIANGDTMVTVTGGNATDLAGVTIGAAAQTGVNLSQGDSVKLLHNDAGFNGTAATTTLTTPPKATSLTVDTSYKFTITQSANDITATVGDVAESANEQAKSLVETQAATTTLINAGADMLASQGFAQAANAVALDAAEQAKRGGAGGETGATGAPAAGAFTPFAAFGGSSLRAESGSYVNTKGFGLNVGFARELSNAQGKLLFGPMVEYGGGSYDSHLDDGTRGDGNSRYFGVGVMARQVNHDGFYYEGSLRGGRVSSDYRGNLDGLGAVEYDSASPYVAAHLGAGKVFSLGDSDAIDGYMKYFYSRQNGDDATIHIANAADEQGSFDAVNSHRLRLGARFTHKVNERSSFYGGLAFQYEFKGDARATFSGNAAPSPSVKGASGMMELGWQVKPGEGPLTLDLGVTGWAGKQRGGSVQLGATWNF